LLPLSCGASVTPEAAEHTWAARAAPGGRPDPGSRQLRTAHAKWHCPRTARTDERHRSPCPRLTRARAFRRIKTGLSRI